MPSLLLRLINDDGSQRVAGEIERTGDELRYVGSPLARDILESVALRRSTTELGAFDLLSSEPYCNGKVALAPA